MNSGLVDIAEDVLLANIQSQNGCTTTDNDYTSKKVGRTPYLLNSAWKNVLGKLVARGQASVPAYRAVVRANISSAKPLVCGVLCSLLVECKFFRNNLKALAIEVQRFRLRIEGGKDRTMNV